MTVTEPTPAASARVADYLRAAILAGDLGPGERIRQEEVAARLGASRLPVREALRILGAEGLVELEANKGARVPRLSAHQVDVLYRMRERLEPLALAESIPNLGDDDVATLGEIQSEIESGGSIPEFLDRDRRLHLLSYSGCRNDHLLTTVTRLWNATQHYRRAFMALSGEGRMWVVNAEHRLILDAIERRDVVDAERYVEGHIRRSPV
jgi:DNA-binding GntR family transcriptional regulator